MPFNPLAINCASLKAFIFMSSFCCNSLKSLINTKNLKHKKNKHKPLNKHKPHLEKREIQCRRTKKEVAMGYKEKFAAVFLGEACLEIYESLHLKGIKIT